MEGGVLTAGKQGARARSVLPDTRQNELPVMWEAVHWGIWGRPLMRAVRCKQRSLATRGMEARKATVLGSVGKGSAVYWLV